MVGRGRKSKKKTENKEADCSTDAEVSETDTTTHEEDNMAAYQAGLDVISKQIQGLQKEMKTDLIALKNEITAQMRSELTGLKEDIDQKFVKITSEMTEQNEKMGAALTRLEEVEKWNENADYTLQDMMKEQKNMMDKLDDLESRSRRNNLRIYGVQEEAEMKSESMALFVEKWLREELTIDPNTDLQIQRAHRALAPKPKTGQPPRSIVLNFQQFSVKEMILRKAWEKKTVTLGGNRIYFDYDYSTRTLQQRKAYTSVKKALKKEGVRFQTPLNKMRIHWPSGVKTYSSAEEAINDLRGRGVAVEDERRDAGGAASHEKHGGSSWSTNRSRRPAETAGDRVRERLQMFQHDKQGK